MRVFMSEPNFIEIKKNFGWKFGDLKKSNNLHK